MRTLAAMNDPGRILTLIGEINKRVHGAMIVKQNRKDEDMDLGIGLLIEFGFTRGSIFYKGDWDIIWKCFLFTQHCVKMDWINSGMGFVTSSMDLDEPQKAREYFVETFDEDEVRLLEYEFRSDKLETAEARIGLLKRAGYECENALRVTGKHLR
jgi:hypothetical protein